MRRHTAPCVTAMRAGVAGMRARGLLLLLVPLLVAAAARPGGTARGSADGPPSGPHLQAAEGGAGVPSFRQDAWYLPDEELLGFVRIPAGFFVIGSDPAIDPLAFDNERWSAGQVQGELNLPEFYIGRYEVTVAQFRAFVDATGFQVDAQTLQAPPTHPVAFVSWPDALAYSRWLEGTLLGWSGTPAEIRIALEDGWRISLPSEVEWEKAARGSDGRIFPWGNEPRRGLANLGGSGTAPVGGSLCAECAYGLADMSGNVWEWTRSPYQPYPYTERDDREGLDADALWVMRGGGFGDTEQNARAAVRGGADPGVRRDFIGFRLVLSRF